MKIIPLITIVFFCLFSFVSFSHAQQGSISYDANTRAFTGSATSSETVSNTEFTTNSNFQGSVDQAGNVSGSFNSTTSGGGQNSSDSGSFSGTIDSQGNYSVTYSGNDDSGSLSGTLSGFNGSSSGSFGFGNSSSSASSSEAVGTTSNGSERESARSRNSNPGIVGAGSLFASLFGPGGAGLDATGGIPFTQLTAAQRREAIALVRMRRLKLWFQREARNCRPNDTECLSRALSAYGNHLRAIPTTDSKVPAIASSAILQAARAVKTSGSAAQTRQILRKASRQIELYTYVRSDDETIASFQTLQKSAVLTSLQEYEAEFVRIAGL